MCQQSHFRPAITRISPGLASAGRQSRAFAWKLLAYGIILMRLRFPGTLRLSCAFGAMLIIGAASAAAPSGQITANPEMVVIPFGASSGSTFISWSTVNCAAAQVTVTAAGGAEQTFGDRVSFQNAEAPWIGMKTFTFRLYGDRTSTNQSDVLPGTERRVFTVPTGTNTKKFLRINAQNP